MAAYEVLLLNTAVPQIQAAQSGDTYVVPRDIAFSAALTLSAGTANGVPYLNGSKVLTTGSALTFDGTTFKVSTANSAYIGLINGTTKGVRFGADTVGSYVEGVDNTGIGSYQPLFVGGSDLRFLTSGSEQMRLTSTGLGIGTSSPADKLDVGVTAAAPSNSNFLGITVGPTSGSTAVGEGVGIGFRLRNTNGGALGGNSFGAAIYGIQTNTAANTGGLAFYTRPDDSTFLERMRLDASGNLGLGVTPSAWGGSYCVAQIGGSIATLNLDGTANSGAVAVNAYNNGTNWLYTRNGPATRLDYNLTAGGAWVWNIAGSGTAGNAISFTQAMTLDASGNLGLGTTSPVARLTLIQGSGNCLRMASNETNNTFKYSVIKNIPYNNNALGNQIIGAKSDSTYTEICVGGGVDGGYAATELRFFTAANTTTADGTERARITSVGNFKIGGSADRATTEGTNQLVLFNGTAPVGTLTDGVSFYSASGEARVMDAAGNSTLLSPHDQSTNEWIFHSKHTPTGKVLRIDVERLLKFVNDHFGLDAVHEFIEE